MTTSDRRRAGRRPGGLRVREALPGWAIALAAGLLAAGCVVSGSGPDASAPDSLDTAPLASSSRPVLATPRPSPVEHPDTRFWGQLVLGTHFAVRFDSLAEMVRAGDAVVVGRPTGIRLGREERDRTGEAAGLPRETVSIYFAEVGIRVEELLAGELLEPGVVRLDILIGDPRLIPELARSIPQGRVLLILRDVYQRHAAFEPDPVEREALRGRHSIAGLDQGFVYELDGRAAIATSNLDPFLLAFVGRPFDEVVGEIRALVAEVGTAPASPSGDDASPEG